MYVMHFPITRHRIEVFQTFYLTLFFSLHSFHHALSTRMGTQLVAFVRAARISTETTERCLFPHFNTLCGSILLKWRRAAYCSLRNFFYIFLFALLKAYLHVILPNILSTELLGRITWVQLNYFVKHVKDLLNAFRILHNKNLIFLDSL